MADWLILFLQLGGFGAVLVVALFVLGKWFLKRITTALDSYTTAYLQQKAAIDARIESLEKLAEEQARLTRTVESIKDEIAAEAKSRDNRWEFRKEVYVNLLNATTDLIDIYAKASSYSTHLSGTPSEQITLRFQSLTNDYAKALKRFLRYADVAPLALADEVAPLVSAATYQLKQRIDWQSLEANTQCEAKAKTMLLFKGKLQAAGRKDLWGTPKHEEVAEADT